MDAEMEEPALISIQRWQPFAPEYLQVMGPGRRERGMTLWVVISIELTLLGLITAVCGNLLVTACVVPVYLAINRYLGNIEQNGPSPGDDLLVADAAPGQDLLVEMWVEVDRALVGYDRGTLWADDSGLCFYGHRSWFRLAPHDLSVAPPTGPLRLPGELEAFQDLTVVVGPEKGIRIGLRPLDRTDGFHDVRPGVPWVIRSAVLAKGPVQPTQMPPRDLDPEFRRLVRPGVRARDLLPALVGLFFIGVGGIGIFTVLSAVFGGAFLVKPVMRAVAGLRAMLIRSKMRRSIQEDRDVGASPA